VQSDAYPRNIRNSLKIIHCLEALEGALAPGYASTAIHTVRCSRKEPKEFKCSPQKGLLICCQKNEDNRLRDQNVSEVTRRNGFAAQKAKNQ
jgi:hypothetical protein